MRGAAKMGSTRTLTLSVSLSLSLSLSVLLLFWVALFFQEAPDSTRLSLRTVASADLTRLPRCYQGEPKSWGGPTSLSHGCPVDLPDVVIPHMELFKSQSTFSPVSHHDGSKNVYSQPSAAGVGAGPR